MIKDYSWKMFETTGDVNSYMLYREAEQTNGSRKVKAGEKKGVSINSKE